MRRAHIWSRYYMIGLASLLLLIGGSWLFVGRLSLFQTASYISLFGSWPRELYQSNVLWLSSGAEVRQTFVAKYPGLYKISVFLARQGELRPGVVVTFHLRESCASSTDLRQVTATISEADFAGDPFYPFIFPPLDSSAGRELCFILAATGPPARNGALGVQASQLDIYAEGEAMYEAPLAAASLAVAEGAVGQLKPAFGYKVFLPLIQRSPFAKDSFDVGFQLYYDGRPLATIGVFLGRLAEHKPYFLGRAGFYIFLGGAYLVGLLILIRRAVTNKPDENH